MWLNKQRSWKWEVVHCQTFMHHGNGKCSNATKIFVQVPLFRDNCVEKQRAYNTMMNVDGLFHWASKAQAAPLRCVCEGDVWRMLGREATRNGNGSEREEAVSISLLCLIVEVYSSA